MRWTNVSFKFWFVHTPPGVQIEGTSGDCDFNRQKSSESRTHIMVKVPHSPL